MRARLRDLTLDMNGKQVLSFTLDEDFRDHYDKYKEKPLTVEIKRYSPKRSKNANDYLWELCTRIAEDQHITKEEVYRKQIREVGVYEPLPIREDAVERFDEAWRRKGIGWFTEVVDDAAFPGYKKIFAYYGSSTYTSAEMSRLIENTIEDCKALGIETASPEELSLLMSDWSGGG